MCTFRAAKLSEVSNLEPCQSQAAFSVLQICLSTPLFSPMLAVLALALPRRPTLRATTAQLNDRVQHQKANNTTRTRGRIRIARTPRFLYPPRPASSTSITKWPGRS